MTIIVNNEPLVLNQEQTIEVNEVNPVTSGETMYSSSVWM